MTEWQTRQLALFMAQSDSAARIAAGLSMLPDTEPATARPAQAEPEVGSYEKIIGMFGRGM